MDRAAAPTRIRCPRCAASLEAPPPATCPSCALAVGSEAGRRLIEVEAQLAALRDERAALVARLVAGERERGGAHAPATRPPPAHRRVVSALTSWLSATGPQSLLAAGGVLLLVVAAMVFTAVTWQDLSALLRGGVLLAAASGAGALTGALTHRGLRRTAEATAMLAVALLAVLARGLWDAGLLGGPDRAALVAAGVAAALALVGHGLARGTGTTAPLVLASWFGPVAPVSAAIWVAEHRPPAPSVDLGDLIVLAAFVFAAVLAVAYAEWQLAAVPRWRAVTQVAGVVLWAVAAVGTTVALGALVDGATPQPGLVGAAVALGAVVVVTALLARMLRHRSRRWDLAGVAAAWFAATTLGLGAQGPPDAWRPLLTLAPSALGIAAALRWLDGRPLRRAAAAGMAPAVAAAGVLVADVGGTVREVVAAHTSAPWAVDATPFGASPGIEPLLTAVVAVPVLAAVAATIDRRVAVGVAVLLGGLTLTAVGIELWRPTGGAVAALAVVAAAAQAPRRWGWTAGVGPAVLAGSMVAVGVGLSSPAVTVGVVLTAAVAAAPAARRDRMVAATVTADLLGLAVAVTAWAGDGSGPVAVALATAVGAAVAVAAAVRGRPDVAEPVEAVALVGGLSAIVIALGAGDAVWPAWTFAVEAITAAGAAVWRPDRRPLRWVATLLASASSSTVLADVGVDLVEAHTMPPALVVLGLSVGARRAGRVTSSWPGLGTGAALLVLPTLVQLADEPTDLPRLVVVLLLGVLLAAAGRTWALQAPLVIGVAALVLAALTQHEVVTDVVPRWVLLAVVGSLLLWLSISYERQRVRLSAARRHLAAMR